MWCNTGAWIPTSSAPPPRGPPLVLLYDGLPARPEEGRRRREDQPFESKHRHELAYALESRTVKESVLVEGRVTEDIVTSEDCTAEHSARFEDGLLQLLSAIKDRLSKDRLTYKPGAVKRPISY